MNAIKNLIIVLALPFWCISVSIVGTFAELTFGEYSPLSILTWMGYALPAGFATVSLMIVLQGKPLLVTWKSFF